MKSDPPAEDHQQNDRCRGCRGDDQSGNPLPTHPLGPNAALHVEPRTLAVDGTTALVLAFEIRGIKHPFVEGLVGFAFLPPSIQFSLLPVGDDPGNAFEKQSADPFVVFVNHG